MAYIATPKTKRGEPTSASLDTLAKIITLLILLFGIIIFYLHNDLAFRLDTKIANARAELSAEIRTTRTELQKEIAALRIDFNFEVETLRNVLEADIQRVDDRIFAIGYPSPPQEEASS